MAAITATLKVSVDELKKGSTRFGSKATETKKLTTQMLQLIESTKSVWQGAAREAYSKKFASLSSDMDKILKMIDEYRQDLSEIAKNYETAESQNKMEASNLKSGIVRG